MKEKPSASIIIWATTALIITGILTIAFISQKVIVENTAEAFNRQQLFLVRESARGLEEHLKNLETSLKTAASILPYAPRKKVLESLFNNQNEFLQSIHLVKKSGETVLSFPPESAALFNKVPDLRKAIKNSDGNMFMTDICTDSCSIRAEGGKNLSLIMGISVQDGTEWVCAVPDFNAINKRFISPVRSGRTGYAWMINSTGVLLAHPNKEMEGRRAIDILKELWPEQASFNLEALINKNMLKMEEGSGEYTGWHVGEKNQTKKLIAYCPVNFKWIHWSIGVSAPYSEVLAPLKESLTGLIISSSCFIIIVFIGAFLLVLQEKRKSVVNQELSWSNEAFNNITDGISIIDKNYKVLKVNRAICEWQENTEQYFKGKPCHKVFQQQEGLCAGCPAKEVFETGKPAFRQRVSTTLGGKKYYFHLSAFPLKDNTGKTVRVAECVRDVTNEMELRSEIINSEQKSMIVKMSAQVAHEIRNPLGTLTLNIDLLEDEISSYSEIDTAEAKKRVSIVKSETENLHKVLKEYLECTRFPSIKPEKHYINAILREMFTAMEEDFRQKQVQSKTSLEYNLPPANVDQDQLKRAFLNIILNALDEMKSGGIIEISTCTVDKWIEITFTDTGTGISNENKDKIFTPFYTTKSSGTGLGLSITKHIITEHQGEILCQNVPEKGASFIVRLPVMEEEV